MGLETATITAIAAGGLATGSVASTLLTKTPKASSASRDSLEKDKKKAKRSRKQLLATEGGIQGEELQPGQVGGRSTLFGN